ncbi:hypothetical protein QUS22_04685, partial [Wolbachia pipientis]|nr:hypothetical protein [Wolbachia pipientis]
EKRRNVKQSDSGSSSQIHANSVQSQVDSKHLTRKLEEEKLNHQKEDETLEEHRKNSKDRNSETHTVSSEPIGKESKSTQSTHSDDQATSELKEVLKRLDKGLKKPAQQVIEKHIPKDSFLENVLEKIKEEKPIYKWLKNKIEGKESNQNLDALEENLSKKSSQGNIGKKRENNSNRLISPVSIEGNIDVEQNSGTQLQKSSRRSGEEPEEELNYQKISEALENWKEKRRNVKQSDSGSSSQIHANSVQSQVDSKQLKKADFSNKPLQSEGTSELKARLNQDNRGLKKVDFTNKPPQNKDESELQKKFSQEQHGLKPANQKGMSKQTRELLLKDGLLKDNSTDVKKVAEREDTDTKSTIDKKLNLHKLLKKDEVQLKIGIIEKEREDTLVEHTNSHDSNRTALGNKNRRLLWTKYIAEQQEKNTKGASR